MTWMPASSSRLAHWMLAASSKRALISTTTATCLPLRDASIRSSTIRVLAEVRYRVILIASTLGSRLASRTKRSTDVPNDS